MVQASPPAGPTAVYSPTHLGGTKPTIKKEVAALTRLKRVFFGRFPDRKEEGLYQEYMRKQKLKIIPAFVFITITYLLSRLSLEAVLSDDEVHLARVGIHAGFIAMTMVVLGFMTYNPTMSKKSSSVCVIILWILVMSSLLVDVAVQSHPLSPSGLVGWVQVIIFTTFVVVPWKLRHCVGMSVSIAVVHSIELFVLWATRQHLMNMEEDTVHTILIEELVADSLLFLGAISLGVLAFAFSERKQRRSFLESKKSHAVSHEIEKQHKEQLRLLQAVLPKYVARVMMQDFEQLIRTSGTQFRKIYMQRFENVSILFADIVGFTAISSSVTACELVKILNQLFANFDSLGHKYHQQRIKILGDCYYCVCGIRKVEIRPDHAVLAIHMGMSMVNAIRDVRRDTGKNVNMRVGIHTGSVLAGVMGQKQWQYDVLGKHVIMANHLESGGLPARVHISEATKNQLEGQFELEEGHGHDRDEYLKLEQVNTYLVKAILKKYPDGTLDANPVLLNEMKQKIMVETGETEDTSSPPVEGVPSDSASKTLKEALFNKSRSRTAMEKLNFWTTWFHDKATEGRYRERRENFSGASLGALGWVLILATSAKLAVLPIQLRSMLLSLLAVTILILMALVSSASGMIKAKCIPRSLKKMGTAIERNRVSRTFWGLMAIITLILADSSTIQQCDIDKARRGLRNISLIHIEDQNDPVCTVPAYFVHVVHLILLGVSSVVQIEHMTKLVIILISSTVYVACYIVVFGPIFDYNDAAIHLDPQNVVPSKYDLSVQLLSAAIALLIINRKVEEISRRLFMWREEASEKTQLASTESEKTEGLVYNILPEHVASYFTGQQRDHMDLYHHGYDDVAVMFAACPNFHDFYNETDYNKQGLECLRLLNEMISDYDELLNKPRFKNSITKIKTVGPTYMAASGMISCEERPSPEVSSLLERYQHVDDIVQFALAMKKELHKISEQSFNTFLLRIGINHGPIIAGVIGATKPHYDIWGNTVNVASRMESTGSPNQIQVVEETKEILEPYGYSFQKRGRIQVKGKGELTTYFLIGQRSTPVAALPHQEAGGSAGPTPVPPLPPGTNTSLTKEVVKGDPRNKNYLEFCPKPDTPTKETPSATLVSAILASATMATATLASATLASATLKQPSRSQTSVDTGTHGTLAAVDNTGTHGSPTSVDTGTSGSPTSVDTGTSGTASSLGTGKPGTASSVDTSVCGTPTAEKALAAASSKEKTLQAAGPVSPGGVATELKEPTKSGLPVDVSSAFEQSSSMEDESYIATPATMPFSFLRAPIQSGSSMSNSSSSSSSSL